MAEGPRCWRRDSDRDWLCCRLRTGGGGGGGGWLLTQLAGCCCSVCLALLGSPCGQTPLARGNQIWSESDQNFAPYPCSAHSERQLLVRSCGAVLWDLRKLEARDPRLGNGIRFFACLFSGEVRVGCGQVETAPEYIPFLY